jgi:hypothetical protein
MSIIIQAAVTGTTSIVPLWKRDDINPGATTNLGPIRQEKLRQNWPQDPFSDRLGSEYSQEIQMRMMYEMIYGLVFS